MAEALLRLPLMFVLLSVFGMAGLPVARISTALIIGYIAIRVTWQELGLDPVHRSVFSVLTLATFDPAFREVLRSAYATCSGGFSNMARRVQRRAP